MASFSVSGIDELNAAFGRIADIPWSVTEDALNAMAEVTAEKMKAQGESMGVRDPESDVHILDKIKPVKAKQTKSGGKQDITFSGTRTRGKNKKKTRNAEIAFVIEFGRRNMRARPFIGTAMARHENEITEPGAKVIGDWIENEFQR